MSCVYSAANRAFCFVGLLTVNSSAIDVGELAGVISWQLLSLIIPSWLTYFDGGFVIMLA